MAPRAWSPKQISRRRFLVTAGVVGLAGCSGSAPPPSSTDRPAQADAAVQTDTPERRSSAKASTETPTPTARPTATPYPEPQLLEFEGTGQSATDYFTPQLPGPVGIAAVHNGSGHFAVWLVDESGREIALVANAIGPYIILNLYALDHTGRYAFDVNGASWHVNVGFYPLYELGGAPTGSYSEDFGTFIGPKQFTGGERVTFSARSSGHVAVWQKNAAGGDVALLFNEIGPVSGLSTRINRAGTGYIDIQSDGAWEMDIE